MIRFYCFAICDLNSDPSKLLYYVTVVLGECYMWCSLIAVQQVITYDFIPFLMYIMKLTFVHLFLFNRIAFQRWIWVCDSLFSETRMSNQALLAGFGNWH